MIAIGKSPGDGKSSGPAVKPLVVPSVTGWDGTLGHVQFIPLTTYMLN